ncbi:hypothetical protein HGRIS_014919 [Hohenbuehelia grisea]|uniref:Uncharacterized protein n=1 Tax=Hohenbuehelia grisea TaxID=104357 RepID=A0ABR3JG21_9AGAR
MSGDSEMIHLRNRCEPPSCLDITLFPLRTNGRACSVNITITYITQREPGSFCIIFFHKRRFPLIFHAMPVDLLSLSSSIATFIDGASKVRDAISKISENNRRLRRIKSDILRELDALEHFCCSRYSTWDGDTAQEVKAALNELQGDFRDIQALCEILLAARSGGILWSARLKSWFKRSTIEGEIRGLEQKIRSCQFRFMMFSSARTEYNTVINHQENRDRLGHIENLVSYMLLRNERSNSQPPFSSLNAAAPDEVDLNFLSYQIQKLVDGLDSVMTKWQRAVEPPSRDWTLTAGPGRIIDCVTFRKALLFSLHAWCVMSSSNGFTLQGLVIPIVELIGNVWATAVSNGVTQTTLQNSLKLAEFSIDACGALYSLDRCDQFEQMLAYTRHLASDFSNLLCDPRAFVFTEQAVSAWQAQFERYGDQRSLMGLLTALNHYNSNLFRRNKLEEALDCSRQALLLLRASQELATDDGATITWHASGEADVVFSSSRNISQTPLFAIRDAVCLWNMAVDLSLAGRYAEAHVAGMDAISCRQALVCAMPGTLFFSSRHNDWPLRIQAWVSIIPNPDSYSDSTSIEEIDSPSWSSSSSTHSLMLTTTSSFLSSE